MVLAARTPRLFFQKMKTDLAVIGQGAVTPAGIGVDALIHNTPKETKVCLVSRPQHQMPVFRVGLDEPWSKRWQTEPRLRRASAISYFLVEAGEQALAGLSVSERSQTGVVIAFSTGCLAYSRRFFESIIVQGQKSASPALFPETVFNSPVSHVAAVLHLQESTYALVGDDAAWIAALKTAWLWLEQERMAQVLVLGAEEFDSACLDAYYNARWFARRGTESPFIPSEGAAGVLVRKARPGDSKIISQIEDGFIYRSKAQALAAGERCFDKFESGLPCYSSAGGHWLRDIERKLNSRPAPHGDADQPAYLGEAATASSAWNTLRGLALLDQKLPRLLIPIWGSTHQIGALKVENRAPQLV